MDSNFLKAFNELATEILLVDDNLRILTMNDAAASNGWNFENTIDLNSLSKIINKQELDKSKLTELKDVFDKETYEKLYDLKELAVTNASSITQRDFLLTFVDNNKKTIDITISRSGEFGIFIFEIFQVDSLNMIIDSTRSFSYQKIAAGLARSLAHEVKNPLSGIKGSAQILKKKYSDDFSKKFLKIIVDETDRLNEIVTKILTPAKKPDLTNFNLHEAIERVLNLIGVDELKNIELIKNYDPSIPDLYGDKNLFIQAVLNIVQNAIQAMTIKLDNPVLKISTGISFRQPINGKVYSTLAQICIEDNGPGIDESIQDQIFFPMVSSKDSGSGLGLSISQDIIRVHGGSISFSRKDAFTKFSILIPINESMLIGTANA